MARRKRTSGDLILPTAFAAGGLLSGWIGGGATGAWWAILTFFSGIILGDYIAARTRREKRVSSPQSLAQYLAGFGRCMQRTHHGSSWGIAGGDDNGHPIRILTYVTTDDTQIESALQALGREGLLCETPLQRNGDVPFTQAGAVHALTVFLRSLSGNA